MRSIPIPSSNLNTATKTLAPTTTTIVTTTPSPWHSPIPYLFGGLAIIMALIAMALLMIACSYWRLTRTQQNNNNNNNVVKEGDDDAQNKEHTKVYEEKILVIMAGDHKPTFLATPSCPNSSSLVIGNHNFHKHRGNSEDCHDDDTSQKEVMQNHHDDVVVVLDATHENNGSSQHEQHSDH